MAFLNPWLLLGLAGVSVPIVIHLLNRFRPKKVAWAAMALLRQATTVRSRQVQIEDLLLLLLRCMAVLLLALALARPTLTLSGASLLGGDTTAAALVAIDGSYSMTHQTGLTSRFDHAVNRLRDIAATLSPGSPFTLAVMGHQPHVLVRNSGYDPASLGDLTRDMTALPEGLNLERNLEEAARLLGEMRAPIREFYLVTDAQATTFADLSDQARLAIDRIAQQARIFVVPIAPGGDANTAVTSLQLTSGALRRGGTGRFTAEVRNFGTAPATGVAVTLAVGGAAVDRRIVDDIAPGQSASVSLLARFDETGPLRFTATIGPDPIAVDNVAHATVVVREHVRVLLVDGNPSTQPFAGDTDFLRIALAPRREAIPGVPTLDVHAIAWSDLPGQRLSDVNVVVLANVADVRSDVVEQLIAFVERGGGLILAPGDNVNPGIWNPRLQALLPAVLHEPIGDADEREFGWRIDTDRPSHPLAQPLVAMPAELRDEARVFRALRASPVDGAIDVLHLTAGDDRYPLLIERTGVGAGRVLLLTTTLNRAWSDWVVHPLFPMLMQQSITHLLRLPQEQAQTVGMPLTLALPAGLQATQASFHDPRGEVTNVQPTAATGDGAGHGGRTLIAMLPEAAWPGFYEVHADGLAAPLIVAVNPDTRESDARTLDASALAQAFAGLPVRIVADEAELRSAISESRVGRELWRPLAMLALAMFVAESLLARRFSARMKPAASPVITGRLSPIRRERVLLDEENARDAA
jgi:hypothetical protein